MLGIEFDNPINPLRTQLLVEEGVFTGSSSNPNVIRLLPPLNIKESEVEFFLEKFIKVLAKF